MGLFDSMFKKSQTPGTATHYYSGNGISFSSIYGGESEVTEEQALTIPAVAASVELISSSIAQLPIYLYRQGERGEIVKIEDRRIFLLNSEPNDMMNGYNFKKQITKDYLFHGASYSKVDRVMNQVLAIYAFPTRDIMIQKYIYDGYKQSAEITYQGIGGQCVFNMDEMVVILRDSEDGSTSRGVLKNNADALILALNELEYSKNILQNGALPVGVLKATNRLTEQALARLKSSWESLYSGAKKAGKTIILEEGLDYKPISLNPNELQLVEGKKSTVANIANIFNVPQSMIDSSANKYASNEQNNLYFLQYCLAPVISAIETSLDRSLLLEEEKRQGYYFRFDVSELLRTTERERIETTVAAMKSGLFSINEARSRVDLPNLDVDYFTWGLGSIFYNPKNGHLTIPNMGTTIDAETGENLASLEGGSKIPDSEEVLKDTLTQL